MAGFKRETVERRGRKEKSTVFANSHRAQIARALNANNINGSAGLTVIKKREKTDVQIVRRVYSAQVGYLNRRDMNTASSRLHR